MPLKVKPETSKEIARKIDEKGSAKRRNSFNNNFKNGRSDIQTENSIKDQKKKSQMKPQKVLSS